MLTYEITSTSFYLTKNGFLDKPTKSQFSNEIRNLYQEHFEAVPIGGLKSIAVFDFMSFCRKEPTKKLKLKTY